MRSASTMRPRMPILSIAVAVGLPAVPHFIAFSFFVNVKMNRDPGAPLRSSHRVPTPSAQRAAYRCKVLRTCVRRGFTACRLYTLGCAVPLLAKTWHIRVLSYGSCLASWR